jgi:hypothetical protein
MPVTNMIDAVQQRYDGITAWTGKPTPLWFGTAWPRNASGTLISLPVVKFTHDGTEQEFTLEGTLTEHWKFEFEVYAETVQACLSHFDNARLGSSAPTSRAGFWLPDSIDVPSGYAFKAVNPRGDYRIDTRDAQSSPTGSPMAVLTWPFEVVVQRLTFG